MSAHDSGKHSIKVLWSGAPLGIVALMALSFTPENAALLTTALGVLLGIIFAGVVNVIAARAAAKKLLGPIDAKLDVIEHATNSASTKSDTIIDSLQIQLKMQQETITKFERQADLMQQAAAIATATATTATTGPVTAPAAEHLEEIEVNTKETADTLKGTARALKTTAKALKGKK